MLSASSGAIGEPLLYTSSRSASVVSSSRTITCFACDSTAVFTNKWDPDTWPQEARCVGFTEAPRGALGHWTVIKNKKVDVYQCVVPTTWNAAPRSDGGQLGPYEAALLGTKMDVPKQPLEILRTLHSFDPCLACSTQVMSEDGQDMAPVTVR